VIRHLPVDSLSIGLRHEARSESPEGPKAVHLRRTKVVAALAVAALVGAGSYAATYRSLVILSTPSALAPAPAPGSTINPSATPVAPFFRSDA
jgi:hypothetical protein